MEAEILRDELDETKIKLLKSQAQVEGLREALEETAKGEGEFSRDQLTFANNVIDKSITVAKKALASIGTDHLKEQLDGVNEVLGLLNKVEWGGILSVKYCNVCKRDKYEGHTKTCRLSKQIIKLEAKRDKLMVLPELLPRTSTFCL